MHLCLGSSCNSSQVCACLDLISGFKYKTKYFKKFFLIRKTGGVCLWESAATSWEWLTLYLLLCEVIKKLKTLYLNLWSTSPWWCISTFLLFHVICLPKWEKCDIYGVGIFCPPHQNDCNIKKVAHSQNSHRFMKVECCSTKVFTPHMNIALSLCWGFLWSVTVSKQGSWSKILISNIWYLASLKEAYLTSSDLVKTKKIKHPKTAAQRLRSHYFLLLLWGLFLSQKLLIVKTMWWEVYIPHIGTAA